MLSRHARRVLATLATLALPSAAAAQGRPASASVSATATVMPVCRIERVGDADSTRAADGALELTLHVHGASNAPWRLLAIALPGGDAGSTDTARVRAADGTWLPLAPGEPVVVARTRDIASPDEWTVRWRIAPGAGTPRLALSCVVDDPRVATGAVLSL